MTTVVVFVPLAFIEGMVGAFFLPFALTVTFALLASLLVALTAELADSIATIDGVVNLESNVAQARPEVAVEVDPEKARRIGLTTQQVGLQLRWGFSSASTPSASG